MAETRLASNPFTAFAIGFKDPSAPGRFRAEQAQLQQEQQIKRQQLRMALMEGALKTLPVGDPKRDAIEARMMQMTGGGQEMANAITQIRPQAPERETKIVGQTLLEVPEKGPVRPLFTAQEKEEKPRFQTLTAVQRGTGATMRAKFNPMSGETTDEAGNLLGPDWITTKTNISAPTPGAITETQQGKSEVELRQNRIATLQALNTSDRMINLVEKNPAAFTTGANLAGFVDTLGTATQSMLFALGVDTALSESNPLDYPDEFWGPLINASDEGKQLAFVLALQLAAATGLGQGRALTDRDVQRAIRLVGTDVQSPERIKARLRSNQRTLMEHHNISRNIILGPGNDIFQDRLKEFGDTSAAKTMSDQELMQALQAEMQRIMSGQ